jgi:hypothetical protein
MREKTTGRADIRRFDEIRRGSPLEALASHSIAWPLQAQRISRALKPQPGSPGRGLPGLGLRPASNPLPASAGSPSGGGI